MKRAFIIRLQWAIIVGLSLYYFYRGIRYRFFEVGLGETFFDKQFWFVLHIASAIAALALGPFQFWTKLRTRRPLIHRTIGKLYIAGSLVGAVTAFYLGITQPYQGSIVPVVLLAMLWFFMTASAWHTVREGNIPAHQIFVVRSYVLALTFVSLRILGDLTEHANILFFIDNTEVKDTTYEWMSWVMPLIACELFLSWLPALRKVPGRPEKRQLTVRSQVLHQE